MENAPSESDPFNSVRSVPAFLVVLAVATFLWPSAATAQSSFVRVHQTGYVANAPKRAYLMSSASSSGASFSVLNSNGSPVYSAAIGASQGSWGSFTHVYALDFDTVTSPGIYTISVIGSISSTSPSFPIDTGENLYSTLLENTLYFYENERDGANFITTPLRTAAGHLNDEKAKVYFTPTFNKKDNAGPLTPTGAVIDAWQRAELAGLLSGMHDGLLELADVITSTQLSLPGEMQPLWGPDLRRVVP